MEREKIQPRQNILQVYSSLAVIQDMFFFLRRQANPCGITMSALPGLYFLGVTNHLAKFTLLAILCFTLPLAAASPVSQTLTPFLPCLLMCPDHTGSQFLTFTPLGTGPGVLHRYWFPLVNGTVFGFQRLQEYKVMHGHMSYKHMCI